MGHTFNKGTSYPPCINRARFMYIYCICIVCYYDRAYTPLLHPFTTKGLSLSEKDEFLWTSYFLLNIKGLNHELVFYTSCFDRKDKNMYESIFLEKKKNNRFTY